MQSEFDMLPEATSSRRDDETETGQAETSTGEGIWLSRRADALVQAEGPQGGLRFAERRALS